MGRPASSLRDGKHLLLRPLPCQFSGECTNLVKAYRWQVLQEQWLCYPTQVSHACAWYGHLTRVNSRRTSEITGDVIRNVDLSRQCH